MPSSPKIPIATAARNNAEWCDAMCRAHGSGGAFDAHAWTTPIRSPRYYPDAVTLDLDATADDLLALVDTAPGCSIKDSFAALDLEPAGFGVLFDAEWIYRPPAPAASSPEPSAWRPVTDRHQLTEWEAAWAAPERAPALFRDVLLDDPNVRVLSGRDGGDIVGGVVLNRAAGVVGMTNVFTRRGDLDATWDAAVRAACTYFPNEAIVGYESGNDLDAAHRHGFATLGPLRVWVND